MVYSLPPSPPPSLPSFFPLPPSPLPSSLSPSLPQCHISHTHIITCSNISDCTSLLPWLLLCQPSNQISQEFIAYGVMNLGGAFFGSFPTAGALSRTVLQDATGGNTQLVGFISSVIVIIVILFLSSLFGPLPNVCSMYVCMYVVCMYVCM